MSTVCSVHSVLRLRELDMIPTFQKPAQGQAHNCYRTGDFQARNLRWSQPAGRRLTCAPWLQPTCPNLFFRLQGVEGSGLSQKLASSTLSLWPVWSCHHHGAPTPPVCLYMVQGSVSGLRWWLSICCCHSHPGRLLLWSCEEAIPTANVPTFLLQADSEQTAHVEKHFFSHLYCPLCQDTEQRFTFILLV